MAIGGFFKALGKGARAVGRGAMKGVLGFDDRDITSKFKKKPGELSDLDVDPNEPDEDEGVTSKYSGYSRGVADLGTNEPGESDGFEADEAPPEVGMTGMESLIGLEMPTLPGFKRKGGMAKPGGVKIEAPKATPTAYETVTSSAAASPSLQIPGIRAMRGSITGDVADMGDLAGAGANSDYWKKTGSPLGQMAGMAGNLGQQSDGSGHARNYSGNTTFEGLPIEDALSDAAGAYEGGKDALINASIGPALKGVASVAKGIPGLTRGVKKGVDWYKNANTVKPYLEPGGPPTRMYGGRGGALPGGAEIKGGYMGSPGGRAPGVPMSAPEAGPGKNAIDEMLSKGRLDRARYSEPAGPMGKPMPGPGGVEGPMPPLPPGLRETSMEVLYSPRTKSLTRVAR